MRSRKYKLKSLFAHKEMNKKNSKSKKRSTSKKVKTCKNKNGNGALWKSNDRRQSLTPPTSRFRRKSAAKKVDSLQAKNMY